MHTPSLLIAVVFYHPHSSHIQHFLSISSSLGHKLAFFNSQFTVSFADSLRSSDILISGSGHNVGLSVAYNHIFNYAISHNFDFVLLLDQDSCVDNHTLHTFKNFSFKFLSSSRDNEAGIISISPLYSHSEYSSYLRNSDFCSDDTSFTVVSERFNINSCSIVPVKLWQSVGGYDEDLFVDRVDLDFCDRLTLNNFKVCKF